jgi:hypothetical protein
MTNRTHTTTRAPNDIRGRLDQQPPLTIDELVRANDEPAQSNQRSRAITTVQDHQGSPSRAVFDNRKSCEAPGLNGGSNRTTQSRHPPTLQREEPRKLI